MIKTNLLILETIEDAKYCFENSQKISLNINDCDIISLQPDIQVYLEKKSIYSISSSDLMDSKDYNEISNKVERIENYFDIYHNDIKESIYPWITQSFKYYFRHACFYFLWDLYFIFNLLEQKNYKNLYSIYSDTYKMSPWVLPEERYISIFLNKISKKLKINHIQLNSSILNKNKKIKKIKKINIFNRINNIILFKVFNISAKSYSKLKSILVTNFFKNMDLLSLEINTKYKDFKFCKIDSNLSLLSEYIFAIKSILFLIFKFRFSDRKTKAKYDFILPTHTISKYYINEYNQNNVINYIKKILYDLKTNNNQIFIYKNITFIDEIEKKAIYDISNYLSQIDFLSFGLEKGLKIINPNLIISQMSLGISCALGHISTKYNIPSILISHGSHILHSDIHAFSEHKLIANNMLLGGYKYLGVQSPSANEMAINSSSKENIIVKLNPTIWGRKIIEKKKNENIFTIVHAGSFKDARRYIYETSNEMLMALKDLVEVISLYPNFKFIIKFRNQKEFSTESLKSIFNPIPKNIIIDDKTPFLEVLPNANLLISFSSTTIEEALVNNVPVLLYGGYGRYSHFPIKPYDNLTSINEPVTFINKKNYLVNYFKNLNKNIHSFEVADSKFDNFKFKEGESYNFLDWFNRLKID